MIFPVFTQEEVLERPELSSFLLDTIIDNLSWLYGEDMGCEEDRKAWIDYNLRTPQPHWRLVAAQREKKWEGFLIYTIDRGILMVNDIQICKGARFAPGILRGLLRQMCQEEFSSIGGYINKGNQVSLDNFLKFATRVEEKANGFLFEIGREKILEIKEKFEKST